MDQVLTAFYELKMGTKFKQEWTLYHGKPHQVQHIDALLINSISSKEMRLNLTIKAFNKTSPGKKYICLRPCCPVCEESCPLYQCATFG